MTTPWNAAPSALRNTYPVVVRDHSLATAIRLLMQSLPYALMRFAIELAFAIAGIVWLVVTFGGSAWLGAHIASAFGWVWLIGCLVGVGWFWGTVLRYFSLMTWAVRSAFVTPIFLIMMMVRYHALIETQPNNEEWDGYLASISQQFSALAQDFRATAGLSQPSTQAAPGPQAPA